MVRTVYKLLPFFVSLFFIPITAFSAPNKASPLGMNTNEVLDMNTSIPFVDLFKLAMPFEQARPWLTKDKIDYDKHGWPKNLNKGKAGTRFINNFPAASIPNSAYHVFYEGKGEIQYGGNVKLIKQLPGQDIIYLRPNKDDRITATLTITKTNPGNHIRNIRIVPPGGICKNNPFVWAKQASKCESGYFRSFKDNPDIYFNPAYLTFMRDFRTIRFMNMSGITRNNLQKWKDRPQLTDATWGGNEGTRGAPLEVMIALANVLKADPWFNLPHRADDDFVKKFAEYTRDNLDKNLKAYIEYTNEAWNGIFSQTHFMMDMGQHQKLNPNRAYAGYKYYSKRSVQIFKIWEKAFGDTQRIVRVMGGMTTNTWLSHLVLGYQDAYKHTDALAIAPYFHAPQSVQKNIKSVDQLFSILKSPSNPYSIPRILMSVRKQVQIAKRFGIDVIAYEGGQHLVAYKTHSNDDGPNPHLIRANKDERMGKLYYEFLEGWKNAGGKLFVAFSAPREYNWIGSWGIKEHIAQPAADAPKYRGLMFFQKKNRCWWQQCTNTTISRKNKPASNPSEKMFKKRFNPDLIIASNDKPPLKKPITQTPVTIADDTEFESMID